MVIIDSVIPTAVTASAPSFDTKKTSTTAKTDSMAISITMGTARRMIARPIDPSVKSCLEPRTASRKEAKTPVGQGGVSAGLSDVLSLMVGISEKVESYVVNRGHHNPQTQKTGRSE